MQTSHKIALAYGASILGAGLVSWWRHREEYEGAPTREQLTPIVRDAALHGLVTGTCISVAIFLSSLNSREIAPRRNNGGGLIDKAVSLVNGASTVGSMGKDAVRLLSQIDVDRLYAPMRKSGVRVAPVPRDESVVNLDED